MGLLVFGRVVGSGCLGGDAGSKVVVAPGCGVFGGVCVGVARRVFWVLVWFGGNVLVDVVDCGLGSGGFAG